MEKITDGTGVYGKGVDISLGHLSWVEDGYYIPKWRHQGGRQISESGTQWRGSY